MRRLIRTYTNVERNVMRALLEDDVVVDHNVVYDHSEGYILNRVRTKTTLTNGILITVIIEQL